MNVKKIVLTALLCAFIIPALALAADPGNAVPKYNVATISLSNTTVDLIPSTSASGNVRGIKCLFPSNGAGAAVKIKTTVDGGTTTSFTIDPTLLEQESNAAGQYLSGWIPMNIQFTTSIQVQLNNTGLGTATINCFASWGTN
jgi:hypothetical protein